LSYSELGLYAWTHVVLAFGVSRFLNDPSRIETVLNRHAVVLGGLQGPAAHAVDEADHDDAHDDD
jgi:hypothetical protein